MTIFEPLGAYGFEWVRAVHESDYERFWELDGTSRRAAWRPIEVTRGRAEPDQPCERSDFPWLGAHALVMRTTAVDALSDLLATGELLPLKSDVELYVFNAHVVNALDEAHASVFRFPSTNRIARIETAAFVESAIGALDIFRLPYRATPTYVTERFVDRVVRAGLVGLELDEVWSSSRAN